MPQQASWLIDNRVLCVSYYNYVAIDDLQDCDSFITGLLHNRTEPLYIIIDITDITGFNFNLKQLLNSTAFYREPALRWLILVGGDPLTKFLAIASTQVGKINFRAADTHEEAIAILRRVDPSLSLLPVWPTLIKTA